MDDTLNRIGLTTRQTVLSALMGAILWFAAAMLIRVLAPMGVFEGMARVWLYLLVIPGTVPFVPLIVRFAGLPRDRIAIGVAVSAATATFFDGVALAWLPTLYGATVDHVAAAGAVILWGVGVVVAIGCWFNRRD
jgi:hypothetical protein